MSGPQVFYYEHSAEGQKLAKSIQDSMNSELSEVRSRVEKSNSSYYILKRSQGTTVIVECGFLLKSGGGGETAGRGVSGPGMCSGVCGNFTIS